MLETSSKPDTIAVTKRAEIADSRRFALNPVKRIAADLAVDRLPVVLFVVCVLLYLPGVWWGLPHVTHSSIPHGWEIDTVSGLATLSELHNLLIERKPDWYVAYPIFHYVVLGALYAPYLLFLLLTGGMARPQGTYPYGFADPIEAVAMLALIARLLSVAMAAGAVVSIYVAVKTVWNKTAATIAAASFAVCVPLTYYGRTGNLDVPVLFWTAVGLVPLARSIVDGLTVRRGVALGALAAITVATKDQGYAAWVCALLTLIFFHQRDVPSGVRFLDRKRWIGPASIVLTGALVYAILSGLIFWPHRYAAHVSFVLNFKKTFFNVVHLNILRPMSPAGYAQLVIDMADCALESVGPVILALALAGMILTWHSRFTRLLLIVMCGHLIMTVFPIRHMQYRYILIPSIVLCILAGHTLARLWHGRSNVRYAAVTLGVCAFIWPVLMSVDVVYQMMFDARYQANQWFKEHAKTGDGLGYWGSPDQVPYLPAGVEPVRMEWAGPVEAVLEEKKIRLIAIIPEHSSRSTGWATSFSDWGLERSWFLPEKTYRQLQDGSLGYRKVAAFKTAPLFWNRPVKFLPWINSPVQIFERTIPFATAKSNL